MRAEAPGKVLLFGEYSVLFGGLSVVAAVDRQVTCEVSSAKTLQVEAPGLGCYPADSLPFVQAFHELTPLPCAHFTLDSRALSTLTPHGLIKLGLGSSAASTVALAAAAARFRGLPLSPQALFCQAQAAHRRAQGSGSGADVAASAFGGLLAYRFFEDGGQAPAGALSVGQTASTIERLAPLPALLLVWTGQAASTPSLISQVKRLPSTLLAQRLASIEEAAQAGLRALTGPTGDLVAAVRAAASAVARLGEAAQVPLWTAAHQALEERARAFGGAVKPTGAGAGDLAWVVAEDEVGLMADLRKAGFLALKLPIAG